MDGPVCGGASPPPGPALLDHANCIHQDTGIVLASCSSTDPMLRPCDEPFLTWCNDYGGDAIACSEEDLVVREHRCGGGPVFLPCDPSFTAACDGADGVFACDDPAQDGTCGSGACAGGPIPVIVMCCDKVNDNGTAGYSCKLIKEADLQSCALLGKYAIICDEAASCDPCDPGASCTNACGCSGTK